MITGLYVVTDETLSYGKTHLQIAEAAIAGGAKVIQLRDKSASASKLYATAAQMAKLCEGRAVFIVNDRVDIAIAAGADGVHLGQDDLPVEAARRIAPAGFIIGLSVNTPRQAAAGVAAGADYLAVSPVFSTNSKLDTEPAAGLSGIEAIRGAAIDVPLVGIGGLNMENAGAAIRMGLDAVAVISAVVSKADITQAAMELAACVEKALTERP